MIERTKPSFGAAKTQADVGRKNELYVLFSLARFGWLTNHQIGQLLWPTMNQSTSKSRRILQRLLDKKEVRFECLGDSPGAQIRAYFLKPSGMKRVLSESVFAQQIRVKRTKRSITDQRYQYHRFLSNQLLIDIRHRRIELPFEISDEQIFMCEHEMQPVRKDLNSHFGCIPDAIVNHAGELLVCEIENSCRGPARHGSKLRQEGNKLQDWLPIYIERMQSYGQFSDHLLPLGNQGSYDDAREIFLCSSEKVFRSIYRKMRQLMGQFSQLEGVIYYIVMNKQSWIEPLHTSNIKILDHASAEAVQLVAVGEERTRKY